MKNFNSHIIIILLLIIIGQTSYAQIKTNVSFSHSYLEKAKAMNKTRKEYKRYVKDSLKQIKKLNKQYDFKMDSLMSQLKEEASERTGISVPSLDILNSFQLDSMNHIPKRIGKFDLQSVHKTSAFYLPSLSDTISIDHSIKGWNGLVIDSAQYTDWIKSNPELMPADYAQPLNKDTVMNMALGRGASIGEGFIKNREEFGTISRNQNINALNSADSHKQNIEQAQDEIKEVSLKKDIRSKMMSSAKNYIANYTGDIQQVKSKMSDLKEKYTYLPNSNDLSSAVKRTSLKGTPILGRLFTGGNINIKGTKPLTLDFSPQVGYRINKLFEIGLSTTYRKQFKSDSTSTQKVYGYSVFVNHKFYNNFFGYLEGERMNSGVVKNEEIVRSWKQTLLLGVGRELSITRWLNMQVIATVNLLHKRHDNIHGNRFVVKTGFRIKK